MIVSGMAITGAAGVAMTLSMLSAYYRGSLDLGVLTVSDGVVSIPQLLLLIMVSAVFADTWLGGVLDGGFLLALIFAFTTWPFLWRAVRGPALQVAQEEGSAPQRATANSHGRSCESTCFPTSSATSSSTPRCRWGDHYQSLGAVLPR